jgi:hypothetical protein
MSPIPEVVAGTLAEPVIKWGLDQLIESLKHRLKNKPNVDLDGVKRICGYLASFLRSYANAAQRSRALTRLVVCRQPRAKLSRSKHNVSNAKYRACKRRSAAGRRLAELHAGPCGGARGA